ncbi:MAG: hypothetical protein U9N35_06025, partial [Euryarchaeota archaeon]|nr:hypothetical protein [Euryarchaeota archaeon]
INWFLGLTSQLVSGTYFPIEELPSWLRPVAHIHPQTYVNKFARLTMGGMPASPRSGLSCGHLFSQRSLCL